MNKDNVQEILRLASLLATARVRRFAAKNGLAPQETLRGTARQVTLAEDNLRTYVQRFQEIPKQ